MKKKNKLGAYEKGVILTGVAVLIIFLILLTADGIKNIGRDKQNIALSEQKSQIANIPNAPVLSAGMIPVKYDGDNIIICKNDSSWYDYNEGIPAYMMLNDGTYQSELVADMTDKKLASKNIGQVVQQNEQGTIYIWIPRYAQNTKTEELKHISVEEQPGGDWIVPETFSYIVEDETKPDFSLSGIWAEKDRLKNAEEVKNKASNLSKENSRYGLIANTKPGTAYDDDYDLYLGDYIYQLIGGTENINLETGLHMDYPNNAKRTNLKVINDKQHEPIKAKLEYNEDAGTIKITVTYTKNGIAKIIDKEGNELPITETNGIITATVAAKGGKNHFTVVDTKNDKKELEKTVISKVYATLYTDGTLAFTETDKTIEGKTLEIEYGDIARQKYSKANEVPWYAKRAEITKVDFIDEVAPTSTAFWFNNFTNITEISNIENLNTSIVTNMSYMFYKCEKLTKLDLSNFDTNRVTNMEDMFCECRGLTELDLSNFNTSKVTNMASMFDTCSNLTKLYVGNLNTRNVRDMNYMFYGCENLTHIDVSNFDTEMVTDTNCMFYNCNNLTSLDLSNFNTSKVTNMGNMFRDCNSLIKLDISNFDTSNVIYMSHMFRNCNDLTKLDLSSFDTRNVINMVGMFNGCSSLTELDLSSFDTRNVTNMSYMFNGSSSLEVIYVGENWRQVSDATDMFLNCGTSTTTRK